MSEFEKPILIFDQECSLCVRFKQALDFLDKEERVKKVPLQDDWIYEQVPALNREDCEETIHLVTPEKAILKGTEVIEYLISFYPGVKKFSWLVENESAKKAANIFYDKVNEIRKKIKEDCRDCGKRGRK